MSIKDDVRATSTAFENAIQGALNYRSGDLSTEGLEKHRKLLLENAREKYGERIAQHRRDMQFDKDATAFDKFRPSIDWSNAGEVAKTQSKWEAVKAKLDAGLSIGQVIANADTTTLAAINEFYADHAETLAIAAGDPTTYEIPDVSQVHRAVDDRAAGLGGDNAAFALNKERTARGARAHAKTTLDQLQQAADGRTNSVNDLASALQADQAEKEAMAGGAAIFENHDPNTETAAVSE